MGGTPSWHFGAVSTRARSPARARQTARCCGTTLAEGCVSRAGGPRWMCSAADGSPAAAAAAGGPARAGLMAAGFSDRKIYEGEQLCIAMGTVVVVVVVDCRARKCVAPQLVQNVQQSSKLVVAALAEPRSHWLPTTEALSGRSRQIRDPPFEEHVDDIYGSLSTLCCLRPPLRDLQPPARNVVHLRLHVDVHITFPPPFTLPTILPALAIPAPGLQTPVGSQLGCRRACNM